MRMEQCPSLYYKRKRTAPLWTANRQDRESSASMTLEDEKASTISDIRCAEPHISGSLFQSDGVILSDLWLSGPVAVAVQLI